MDRRLTAILLSAMFLAAGIVTVMSDESADAYTSTADINQFGHVQSLTITADYGEYLNISDSISDATLKAYSVSGLPAGMTAGHDGNTFWIRGAATESGTFATTQNFTIKVSVVEKTMTSNALTFIINPPIVSHTVSFNSNGGSAVSSQTINNGDTATRPANPSYGVKIFGGWYTDSGLTNAYDFNSAVTSDITLYAKWTDPNVSITSTQGNMSMLVGQLYAYNVATNPSATVTVSGASWLSVSGSQVYGTPSAPGTYTVTITASASGYIAATQTYTISVSSVLAPTNAPSNGAVAYLR